MNLTPTHKYDDIIDFPHHVSSTRPHMSMIDRAAQFSPFAALTGFEEAVNETARLTEGYTELEEEQILEINRILVYLTSHLADNPEVILTYFLPDNKKAGGSYNTIHGIVTAIDQTHQLLHIQFTDHDSGSDQVLPIPFHQITKIEPISPSDTSAVLNGFQD